MSYGMQAERWLDSQHKEMDTGMWRDALVVHREQFVDLFDDLDRNKDGSVSRVEFRKAMRALGLNAPVHEVKSNRIVSRHAACNSQPLAWQPV